jgi:putative SOS response-associated peptidase YedK
LAIQYLNGQPPNLDWMRPIFNMAPTQNSPVVVVRHGEPAVDRFRWGLIPFWAKSVTAAAKHSLINARGEEITEKRTYAIAFKRRRCVGPLSRFYEWKGEDKTKHFFAIQLHDHPSMLVAGG